MSDFLTPLPDDDTPATDGTDGVSLEDNLGLSEGAGQALSLGRWVVVLGAVAGALLCLWGAGAQAVSMWGNFDTEVAQGGARVMSFIFTLLLGMVLTVVALAAAADNLDRENVTDRLQTKQG